MAEKDESQKKKSGGILDTAMRALGLGMARKAGEELKAHPRRIDEAVEAASRGMSEEEYRKGRNKPLKGSYLEDE